MRKKKTLPQERLLTVKFSDTERIILNCKQNHWQWTKRMPRKKRTLKRASLRLEKFALKSLFRGFVQDVAQRGEVLVLADFVECSNFFRKLFGVVLRGLD